MGPKSDCCQKIRIRSLLQFLSWGLDTDVDERFGLLLKHMVLPILLFHNLHREWLIKVLQSSQNHSHGTSVRDTTESFKSKRRPCWTVVSFHIFNYYCTWCMTTWYPHLDLCLKNRLQLFHISGTNRASHSSAFCRPVCLTTYTAPLLRESYQIGSQVYLQTGQTLNLPVSLISRRSPV